LEWLCEGNRISFRYYGAKWVGTIVSFTNTFVKFQHLVDRHGFFTHELYVPMEELKEPSLMGGVIDWS
jgi:hypothetical protein